VLGRNEIREGWLVWTDTDQGAILQLLNSRNSCNSFFSFLAIMEADRPIDIVIAFSGEEKKLDTA
jgi:hypothetical protein